MKNFVTNFNFRAIVLVVLSCAMIFSTTLPTRAQELSPDHLALARKYVDLTDNAQLYERALIQTGINSMRTILSQNPEITNEVGDSIGEVIKYYSDRKDELFDQFARIYALRFSVAELREITAFYETDVGRKLASENQSVNEELSSAMQIFQANLNTEFFAKVRAELRGKGIEL